MKQKDRNRAIRYLNSTSTSLFECYQKPSKEKLQIWEDIKLTCHADKGHGLKIISANSYQFTAAYLFELNGEEYLKYFTRNETFLIPMSPVRKELDNDF